MNGVKYGYVDLRKKALKLDTICGLNNCTILVRSSQLDALAKYYYYDDFMDELKIRNIKIEVEE